MLILSVNDILYSILLIFVKNLAKNISMKKHHSAVLFFLSFFVSLSLEAYNLKQITNRDNLSNNSITSLCQDHTGLLWIGTCDGLDMYNGRSVSTYKPKDNNNILSGNVVDRIIETDDGVLWIQTYYGLNKYDKKTNSLEHFDMFNKVLFIEKDSHNNLFIIQGDNSIYYYLKEENRFEKIDIPNLVFNDILNFFIYEDKIWIFIKNGHSLCFSIQTENKNLRLKKEEDYIHGRTVLYSFNEEDVVFYVDSDFHLYELDPKTRQTVFIADIRKQIQENGIVASIIKFHEDYFIGFKTNGLFVLRKTSKQEKGYSAEKIPINCGIFTLIEDKHQDIVWIGTDGQGVYSYSNNSYSIRSTLFNDFSLRMSRPVRAMYIDDEKTLWIGSKGDGILKIYDYDISKNVLDCRMENLTISNSHLKDNSVYSFAQSKRPILWIGNEEGLNYYSYADKSIKSISLLHNGLEIKYIHDIYEQDSILWLASVGMGAIKAQIVWNGNTPSLKVLNRFVRSDGDISSNYFFALYPENDKYIWFANRGGGVFKINTNTFGVEPVKFPDNIGNKTINEVFSITKDQLGDYLIGTSFGLIKYKSDKDYEVLNTTNGFPNNTIHCILRGNNDDFWLSTNRGVINYNPKDGTFKTYESSDGLNVFEFSDGAAFRDEKTGTLFFGGINGFISIKENNYQMKEYMPAINFDHLTILGRNYNIMDFLSHKKESDILTLDYGQNFFSLSFVAIDYLNGNNYTYFYKLEGLNDQWIDNGNSNTVSFTNFNPGEYTLLVKYYNRANSKESLVYSIKINILPPWYQSTLAYLIYFILALISIALIIRWIMIKNRKKQIRILRKMEQQHKEDIYESKLRFFTNIAHEFCTPLTLIYGPCNQILTHKNVDKFVSRYTQVIQQNAQRLNTLILDLIEFRRVETGYKKPKIEKIDVSEVANQVIDLFSEMAENRNVKMEKDIPDFTEWNSDKEFIITIMTNLISNALKYTTNNGNIKVRLQLIENSLNLIISNTGKGMKEEDIKKIFDRYSILDNFENQERSNLWSRNGLGLAISYSMVNLLGGNISVESLIGEWTHFSVQLPWQEANTEGVAEVQLSQIKPMKAENNIITSLPKYTFNETKPTILIIDDELEMLWFISEVFADDFNVMCADRPSEALEILKDIHPDIILCDVMMSGMDGISFTKELKSNSETAHIPLILISAKHEVDEQIEGINAGAELYITKPFNVDYLKTSVKQLITRKEALKDYFSSPLSAFELANGKLTHKEHKKLIKNIFDIINKNIRNKDLSVNFIAMKMNMSTRNLYRKMEEINDVSIADMIRDSRLYVAEDLLVKSKLTIDEIIFKSGFANRVSFFKAFSKKYSCTPKEYRDKNSLE